MTIKNTSLRQLNMTLEYRSQNNNVDTYETYNVSKDNKNTNSWIYKKLSNPETTINLATMFFGTGAVEFALKRLKLKVVI